MVGDRAEQQSGEPTEAPRSEHDQVCARRGVEDGRRAAPPHTRIRSTGAGWCRGSSPSTTRSRTERACFSTTSAPIGMPAKGGARGRAAARRARHRRRPGAGGPPRAPTAWPAGAVRTVDADHDPSPGRPRGPVPPVPAVAPADRRADDRHGPRRWCRHPWLTDPSSRPPEPTDAACPHAPAARPRGGGQQRPSTRRYITRRSIPAAPSGPTAPRSRRRAPHPRRQAVLRVEGAAITGMRRAGCSPRRTARDAGPGADPASATRPAQRSGAVGRSVDSDDDLSHAATVPVAPAGRAVRPFHPARSRRPERLVAGTFVPRRRGGGASTGSNRRATSVRPVEGGSHDIDAPRALRPPGVVPVRDSRHVPPRWSISTAESGWLRVEEYVDDGTLVVRAELPDIDPDKDVELSVTNGVLHIRAQREEKTEKQEKDVYRSEFRYGSFVRNVASARGRQGGRHHGELQGRRPRDPAPRWPRRGEAARHQGPHLAWVTSAASRSHPEATRRSSAGGLTRTVGDLRHVAQHARAERPWCWAASGARLKRGDSPRRHGRRRVTPVRGLTQAEAVTRLAADGPNELPAPRGCRRGGGWRRRCSTSSRCCSGWPAAWRSSPGCPSSASRSSSSSCSTALFAFAQEDRAEHAAERLRDLLPAACDRGARRRAVQIRPASSSSATSSCSSRVTACRPTCGSTPCTRWRVDTSTLTGESVPAHPAAGDDRPRRDVRRRGRGRTAIVVGDRAPAPGSPASPASPERRDTAAQPADRRARAGARGRSPSSPSPSASASSASPLVVGHAAVGRVPVRDRRHRRPRPGGPAADRHAVAGMRRPADGRPPRAGPPPRGGRDARLDDVHLHRQDRAR